VKGKRLMTALSMATEEGKRRRKKALTRRALKMK
jgi:hypothetical protein